MFYSIPHFLCKQYTLHHSFVKKWSVDWLDTGREKLKPNDNVAYIEALFHIPLPLLAFKAHL